MKESPAAWLEMLDEEDQQAAKYQVVQNGIGGDRHQRAACALAHDDRGL